MDGHDKNANVLRESVIVAGLRLANGIPYPWR
jgi:hypothetical protein